MKRFINGFLVLGFLHLAYGLFVSFWRPTVWTEILPSSSTRTFYDYAGAINIRTTSSSGSGTLDDVVVSAQAANLDFIVVTDFNNFHPDNARETYNNNLLVIIGGEYSYLDSRILNFDFSTTEHLQGPGRSQVVFADILSEYEPTRPEGLFVLAHPFKPGYRTQEPYPKGLNGIELINLKSVWQDSWLSSKISFFWTVFVYPFNSNLAFLRLLAGAGKKEIELWDRLNSHHPAYGFFGTAAEARLKLPGDLFVSFPSYQTLFSIVRNHILLRSELTGNAPQDRKKISEALRKGQFYMSLDMIQNPEGVEFYATDHTGNLLPLGSEFTFNGKAEVTVQLPAKPQLPFEVEIYKNGEKILTSTSLRTSYAVHGPGVYRCVVRLKVPLPIPDGRKWINWIVANPFYIRAG